MERRYNPEVHRRQSIRLPAYDYSRPGIYYVTLCTRNRECLFGTVLDGHVHGIVIITDAGRGGSRTAPTTIGARKPLGRLIGAFKTVSTKRINALRSTPGISLWQRNYYEHIIRSDDELYRIQQYIRDNPMGWLEDRENPLARVKKVHDPWRV